MIVLLGLLAVFSALALYAHGLPRILLALCAIALLVGTIDVLTQPYRRRRLISQRRSIF